MAERLLIRGLHGSPSAIATVDGGIVGLDAAALAAAADVVIDGAGLTAHPGFIDLQVNGVNGFDFTADPGSILLAGEALASHGVTAYLPTIVTGPRGAVEAAFDALAGDDRPRGAVPLGLHIEGPFISPARRGAHAPEHLRAPDLDEIAAWLAAGMRMITLAPELPGALDAIGAIVDAGAVAAIGHTDADAETTTRAVDAGARYATHLFNAMPPLEHRRPGPVGALLVDERVTVGLIADGVHVDPLVLGLVARVAAGRVSIVSDAVATGLGGRVLDHRPSGARLADGTLAGGSHGLDHGVRTFAAIAGRAAAIAAVTEVPARLLGLDGQGGAIRVGGRADFVLLDDDLEVAATIVGGRVAYLRGPGAAAPGAAPG